MRLRTASSRRWTALAEAHADRDPINPLDPLDTMSLAWCPTFRMDTVILPCEAFFGHTEMVPRRETAGRVSVEMICPYPPGIPIIAPGEQLRLEVVDYLQEQASAGVMVGGAADETLAHFWVVSD